MNNPQTIEVVNIPSLDDQGDWYVVVDGKPVGYSFWHEENAQRAADDYLWRGMPIG